MSLVSMDTKKFIGVDIGGTKCAIVLGTDKPQILDRESFQTKSFATPDEAIQQIIELISTMLERNHWNIKDVTSIGISCGGPLDSKSGVIMSPPNLPGWDDVPIASILEKKFDVPTFLQNDANACAIAEWLFGAGKGTNNMIFLTFGTGFGAGLILDGHLYSGTNDMAGEIGHVRIEKDGPVGYGKAGSMEGFCSGGGIAQLASKLIKDKLDKGIKVGFCPTREDAYNISARDVGLAAEADDPVAQEILQISGQYLGKGLAILIDILNPEKIVIGSIFARAQKYLWPSAKAEITKEALDLSYNKCEVVPAKLDEAIGDYGCLCVAMYGVNSITK